MTLGQGLFLFAICAFAIIAMIMFILERPFIYFKFHGGKDNLLNSFLKSRDISTEDRIVYLTQQELKDLMKEIYSFFQKEVDLPYRTEFGQLVTRTSLRHSTTKLLYLESIVNGQIENTLKFVNSLIDNKVIKLKPYTNEL